MFKFGSDDDRGYLNDFREVNWGLTKGENLRFRVSLIVANTRGVRLVL